MSPPRGCRARQQIENVSEVPLLVHRPATQRLMAREQSPPQGRSDVHQACTRLPDRRELQLPPHLGRVHDHGHDDLAAHGDDGTAAAYRDALLAQPDFLEWSAEALSAR